MSLIEQTPKTFNKKQDHGTAAEQRGHHTDQDREDNWQNEYRREQVAKDEAYQFKLALNEVNVNYDPTDFAALEAEADKILGETAKDIESSPFLKASDEILKAIDDIDDESMSEVVDEYRSLYTERQEVLASIDAEPDEATLELKERAEELQAELELLEEQAIYILNTQDNFKTEAELGLKSKKDIRDKLAKIATIDHNPDDDPEDPDYQSPIRIRNRL